MKHIIFFVLSFYSMVTLADSSDFLDIKPPPSLEGLDLKNQCAVSKRMCTLKKQSCMTQTDICIFQQENMQAVPPPDNPIIKQMWDMQANHCSAKAAECSAELYLLCIVQKPKFCDQQNEGEAQTNQSMPDQEDVQNPQAKGIILKFKHWPLEPYEIDIILIRTESFNLTEGEESQLPFFKTWIFEWAKPETEHTAQEICKIFTQLSFVKSCEPDSELKPA